MFVVLCYLFYFLIVLQIVIIILYIPFRAICFFKKTCKKKNCPLRYTNVWDDLGIAGCKKCRYPYDSEEQKALERDLENIRQKLEKNQ